MSTLAAGKLIADPTLTVVDPSTFPPEPRFRIRVGADIMRVTAVAGAVFTVDAGTEGTTAADHPLGARVTEVLTAEALTSALSEVDYAEVPFTFATASPLDVTPILASDVIDRIGIVISTAFDDPSATLRLGTVGSPGFFLDTNQNDATTVGQYESDLITASPGTTTVRLTIQPLASTQGAGLVIYKLRR